MHAKYDEMSLVPLSCFSFFRYPNVIFIKVILSHTTSTSAIIITYPYSDLNINLVVILPSLIISLHCRLPCGIINDTLVYPLSKMLHRYILCASEIVHDSEYFCSLVIVLSYV